MKVRSKAPIGAEIETSLPNVLVVVYRYRTTVLA